MTIALRGMSLCIVLLASCASRSPSAEGNLPTDSAAQAVTLPQTDVAWDNRVDYEDWKAPVPPGQDSWPTEPPSRWSELRARLILPSAVTPGETVDYAIVLRNLADAPVDLRPCGGYEQEVMGVGVGLAAVPIDGGTSTYRLNCDTEPILLPDESRRYAMRIVVPRDLTGHQALFRWGFVDNMPDYEAQTWIGLTTS